MFTGIIEQMGRIESLNVTPQGGRLRVQILGQIDDRPPLVLGSSIAVNGCCLTAVELGVSAFAADLSAETLRRTSFAETAGGKIVNLERPLRAGDELGGHMVQGHVDGVGRVMRLVPEGENWWLGVRVPEEFARYVAEKGSITIDGLSLTVAAWHDSIAEIAVIPFTYQHTDIRHLAPGDAVNLECDVLAKYVVHMFAPRKEAAASNLSIESLRRQGF
jgi:riboflavin synthase